MVEKNIVIKNIVIQYIKNYQKKNKRPPSIISCIQDLKSEYLPEIIEGVIWDLINEGILKYFSFHAYLTLVAQNIEDFHQEVKEDNKDY